MQQYYLEIIENKEYRENGSLMYEETRVILKPNYQHLFSNQRIDSKGNVWIRINKCVKYRIDGSEEWRLDYEDDGSVKKKEYDHRPRLKTPPGPLERPGQGIQGQIPFLPI